jgi:16S rRNA (cytosine967-C5)-methyltransferase
VQRSAPQGPDTRSVILGIVEETLGGRDLQNALNQALSRSDLSESSKGLCTAVCYGYLRLKLRIDFILSRNIKGKTKKLPKKLLQALGVAAYEILYLDGIPEYATVHWYVEFTKLRVNRGLAGLTNAVLRQVIRSRDEIEKEAYYRFGTSSRVTFLSRYYACPQWIVDLWLEAYGEAACLEYLRQSVEEPYLGLRVNRSLPEHETLLETLRSEPGCVAEGPSGAAFEHVPAVPLEPLERKGLLSRQSFAVQSMLFALSHEDWPHPIWDACAGRGGKTCFLLEQGLPDVWASDLSRRKLLGLRQEADRLHLQQPLVFTTDAGQEPPLRQPPGSVLLDAPCSGLGVLSRRPDIKWKRHPGDVTRLAQVQAAMLERAYEVLRPGGYIIYVTCTLHPEENERQVERLSSRHPGRMSVLDLRQTDWESGSRELFFAAKLLKT